MTLSALTSKHTVHKAHMHTGGHWIPKKGKFINVPTKSAKIVHRPEILQLFKHCTGRPSVGWGVIPFAEGVDPKPFVGRGESFEILATSLVQACDLRSIWRRERLVRGLVYRVEVWSLKSLTRFESLEF